MLHVGELIEIDKVARWGALPCLFNGAKSSELK